MPDLLEHPLAHGFRPVLLVALGPLNRITGFALVLHFPEIRSSFLDFLAVRPELQRSGVGSALYEATREYLREAGSRGLYLEALPDDPALLREPNELQQNRRRLRFYERYGVRPLVGTAYETPVNECTPPYLLFDGLGRGEPLRRSDCRAAVRMILERRYRQVVSQEYVEQVVQSIKDEPVRMRAPRYIKTKVTAEVTVTPGLQKAMAMVASETQRIHHVRERGYVERPARVDVIREALGQKMWFDEVAARHYGEQAILGVHDADFVRYLRAVCERLAPSPPVYPYVFPIRRPERRPKDLALRAGYYCIDTFTPLDRNAYRAARTSVDVALTATEQLLGGGRRAAYAVCRPPGHHAGRRTFGGFCYFNNAAIAAQRLCGHGRVALLDLDFHHGNGTQDIFWRRGDVLTLSIHGHPNYAYPHFSGFADEVGEGPGRGSNQNYPLPEKAGEKDYRLVFEKALGGLERFRPMFVVVSLGFDTMKGDATGSFSLEVPFMEWMGQALGQLRLPLLVVQEGGYSLPNLRRGAVAFFRGVARALAAELFKGAP